MKGRESGMPGETTWASFFDADCIVKTMQCAPTGNESIAEFGCGYGTFTLPVARITTGELFTFDIEADMVNRVNNSAVETGLTNIHAQVRDFLMEGTGLDGECIDHVMVYNLLHIEESLQLLREARRILRGNGILSIIHWNPDPDTPRGPPMDIRPTPEHCVELAQQAGFKQLAMPDLSICCEHHYGIIFKVAE